MTMPTPPDRMESPTARWDRHARPPEGGIRTQVIWALVYLAAIGAAILAARWLIGLIDTR